MYSTVKQILLFAAVILFTACGTDGKQVQMNAGLIPVDVRNDASVSAEIEEFLTPYQDRLEAEMSVPVAFASLPLLNGKKENPLGNFLTDILLNWAVQNQKKYPVPSFTLLNCGGIRNPFPEGEITLYNVFQTMPFDNTAAFVMLNPESVSGLINYIVEKENVVISNATIEHINGQTIFAIEGNPYNKDEKYILLTSDYLAKGGDHMDFFSMADDIIITETLIRDIIIEGLGNQENPFDYTYKKRINIQK